jgi:hypothetical protein
MNDDRILMSKEAAFDQADRSWSIRAYRGKWEVNGPIHFDAPWGMRHSLIFSDLDQALQTMYIYIGLDTLALMGYDTCVLDWLHYQIPNGAWRVTSEEFIEWGIAMIASRS